MEGEYYLHGVMETASGFKLNADSTFEFFYSYGALDRSGSGKWKLVDNTLFLNSKHRPPKDFALIKNEVVKEDFIEIHITDSNPNILRYVDCNIKTDKGEFRQSTDQQGIMKFPKNNIQSVSLLFRLCPDRYSVFAIQNKQDNYFEFRFEPWIADVFFENFSLKVEKNKLTGKHPFLTGDTFSYEKSN